MKDFWNLAIMTALMTSSSIFLSPAQAQRVLGGIDVSNYCQNRYGGKVAPVGATLSEYTAWGWRCSVSGQLVSLSMDDACRWQYRNQRAYSKVKDSRNPFSWICLVN